LRSARKRIELHAGEMLGDNFQKQWESRTASRHSTYENVWPHEQQL